MFPTCVNFVRIFRALIRHELSPTNTGWKNIQVPFQPRELHDAASDNLSPLVIDANLDINPDGRRRGERPFLKGTWPRVRIGCGPVVSQAIVESLRRAFGRNKEHSTSPYLKQTQRTLSLDHEVLQRAPWNEKNVASIEVWALT